MGRWLQYKAGSGSILPTFFLFSFRLFISCDRVSDSTRHLLRTLSIAQDGLKLVTVLLNTRVTGFAMPDIQNPFLNSVWNKPFTLQTYFVFFIR